MVNPNPKNKEVMNLKRITKYGKLRERIGIMFPDHPTFARKMNMNPSTLSAKLNGKSDWTREEIIYSCSLLDIPIDEVTDYFFS